MVHILIIFFYFLLNLIHFQIRNRFYLRHIIWISIYIFRTLARWLIMCAGLFFIIKCYIFWNICIQFVSRARPHRYFALNISIEPYRIQTPPRFTYPHNIFTFRFPSGQIILQFQLAIFRHPFFQIFLFFPSWWFVLFLHFGHPKFWWLFHVVAARGSGYIGELGVF